MSEVAPNKYRLVIKQDSKDAKSTEGPTKKGDTLASFDYTFSDRDLTAEGFPGKSFLTGQLLSFNSKTKITPQKKGVPDKIAPYATKEEALQFLKEYASFNASSGDWIGILNESGQTTFSRQFAGVGREQAAFMEATPQGETMSVVSKQLLHRSYQNIDPATGKPETDKRGKAKVSDKAKIDKFEAREKFLQLLQQESVDILGENVRFPEKIDSQKISIGRTRRCYGRKRF